MDLQSEGLPLCDGGPAADERVDRLRRAVAAVMGSSSPLGSTTTSHQPPPKRRGMGRRAAFEGKVVAFAAVGGGPGSLPCVASLTTPMLWTSGQWFAQILFIRLGQLRR